MEYIDTLLLYGCPSFLVINFNGASTPERKENERFDKRAVSTLPFAFPSHFPAAAPAYPSLHRLTDIPFNLTSHRDTRSFITVFFIPPSHVPCKAKNNNYIV